MLCTLFNRPKVPFLFLRTVKHLKSMKVRCVLYQISNSSNNKDTNMAWEVCMQGAYSDTYSVLKYTF